jgi:hypothetical protein
MNPTIPLRLKDALHYAFPAGGMTVKGLRRERDRGTLIVERIAGRDYTTLANIEEMRRRCQTEPKAPVSTSVRRAVRDKHTGSSLTPADLRRARDAARVTLRELSKRLGVTSPSSD